MILSEYHQKAIDILADSYGEDFAKYVSAHPKFIDLLQDLSEHYVNRCIPIVDVDATFELGLALISGVTVEKLSQNPLLDGQFSINITE